MKIKTNLRAGMTFAQCDAQRNYMKQAAQSGNCAALSQKPPQTSTTTKPTTTYQPPTGTIPAGGYYGGVYYPDQSGVCG
jgi:hypothetical protein